MAITKGMIAQSNIDMDQVHRIIDRYRISNVKTRVEAMSLASPMYYSLDDTAAIDYNAYVQHTHVNMITMDVAEPEFAKMVSTLDEFHNMMRDPEVAKLLLEAKFIYRLRKGHM